MDCRSQDGGDVDCPTEFVKLSVQCFINFLWMGLIN